jgi:hypothetical protein
VKKDYVEQSSDQALKTSEIVGSILDVKRPVNALPKGVGFLRALRFPPTKNVDSVGWD